MCLPSKAAAASDRSAQCCRWGFGYRPVDYGSALCVGVLKGGHGLVDAVRTGWWQLGTGRALVITWQQQEMVAMGTEKCQDPGYLLFRQRQPASLLNRL